MKSVVLSAVLALAASVACLSSPALAAERDRQFFQSVEGNWSGPGEIIAGKYKGTKFVCNFAGTTPAEDLGMTLDGSCRVGVFTQKMTATVKQSGPAGYKGKFMDGAEGTGLDIISGNVVDGQKVVFGINRKQLRGVMQARLPDDQSMTVTVSVRVDKSLVQVIGMSLKRVDGNAVGSIARK